MLGREQGWVREFAEKILNLPSKGDRSNTCVRSEGCCAVYEPVNCTTSTSQPVRLVRNVVLRLVVKFIIGSRSFRLAFLSRAWERGK